MDLEELKSEMESLKASNEAMASKNKELLHELKVTKAKAKEIDPEEHAQLLTEVEELRSENSNMKKELGGQVEQLTQLAQTKSERLEKYLVENTLNKALLEVGIHKDFLEAVFAMHRGQISLADDDNVRIGDKSVAEYITEWAESDKGKPFIAAKTNVGAGSPSASNSTSFAGKKLSEMSDGERIEYKNLDPEGFMKQIRNS